MQINEAKKQLKSITTKRTVPKKLSIDLAKKRLLECDPDIDISQALFFADKGEFSKVKSILFTQLVSQNMIEFLSEPLIKELQNLIALKITDFIFTNSGETIIFKNKHKL
jgi:hypothetical protein